MKAIIETDVGTFECAGPKELLNILEKSLEGLQPKCPAGCHDCCCPVSLVKDEADRIGKSGASHTDWNERNECEFLTPNGCSCYDKRPLTCRVYGCASSGYYKCGKLTPEQATIDEAHGNAILEGYFWIMADEGSAPSMEMIEACAAHDMATGLRSSNEDVEALKKLVKGDANEFPY